MQSTSVDTQSLLRSENQKKTNGKPRGSTYPSSLPGSNTWFGNRNLPGPSTPEINTPAAASASNARSTSLTGSPVASVISTALGRATHENPTSPNAPPPPGKTSAPPAPGNSQSPNRPASKEN